MKTAVIYLQGIPEIDVPESIKTVEYQREQQLIDMLKDMQEGYCEGENPKIEIMERIVNGKNRRVIMAYSSSDYYYCARLGLRLKQEVGKPYEILS